MNPFSNKIFAVEIGQDAQSYRESACKLLSHLWKVIYRRFLFSDKVRNKITFIAPLGVETNYGGITMNNENKQPKPNCPLIGENGNIFNLVGLASRTLKRNGMSAEASEMTKKVFGSSSYEEALGIIGEYVNITSVDDPDEDFNLKME